MVKDRIIPAVQSSAAAAAAVSSSVMSTNGSAPEASSRKRPRAESSPINDQQRHEATSTPTPTPTTVLQTPHTLRLLRLSISGTSDHSNAARKLLSDLASRSSPEILWDLLGRLVVGGSSGNNAARKSNASSTQQQIKTGLYSSKWSERENAAGTIGAIAAKLPGVDRRNFLAEDHLDKSRDGNDNEAGLWLRVEDLIDDDSNCDDNIEGSDESDTANSKGSSKKTAKENSAGKLNTILEQGRLLLSSSGESYDYNKADQDDEERAMLRSLDESAVAGGKDNSHIDTFLKRRVRLQRQILARRLGLGGIFSAPIVACSSSGGSGVTDDILGSIVDDSDLLPVGNEGKADGTVNDNDAAASARRRNMERLKKRRRGENGDAHADEEGVTLRALLVLEMRRSAGDDGTKHSSGRLAAPSHRNPQTLLATDLLYRTFAADWTVRHGALMGILALVKSWMAGFDAQTSNCFGRWPHDILARCLCILALDRFGDYSGSAIGAASGEGGGDRVVAPVRETAAQLLSLLLSMAPESAQRACYTVLCRLVRHEAAWEVRHGGMLAVKYIAALRTGSLEKGGINRPAVLRCSCWDDIASLAISGLSDGGDDVRGTSAQVLACYFRAARVETVVSSSSLLNRIVEECSKPLWSALLEVGSVSPCAVDILALFADVMGHNCDLVLSTVHSSIVKESPLEFGSVLQKLASFLDFDDAAVRLSALEALGSITQPMVAKVAACDSSDHAETLLVSIITAYCKLISVLFLTNYRDGITRVVDRMNGDDRAAELQNADVLSAARNDAWEMVINAVPLLVARETENAGEDNSNRRQGREMLFRMLSSLILRFIGIERGIDPHTANVNPYRIKGTLDTLEEKFSASFAQQRSAATALAGLCFQLGLIPSEKTQPGDGIASSSSFLVNLLHCLSKSPWPSVCEASCILFAALGDVAAASRIENTALFQCRHLFTSMLVDSPCCVQFSPRHGSASILRDATVINACDLALISMIDTNTVTLAQVDNHTSNADALPVTPDQVFELWQGIFRAKGFALPLMTSANPASAKGTASKAPTTSSMRLSSSIAGAGIAWGLKDLPIKLTPIIRPLMTSLKNEEAAARLNWTCLYLSRMLSLCPSEQEGGGASLVPASVRDKMLSNVCTVALADATPASQSMTTSASSVSAGKQLLQMIARRLKDDISEIAPLYSILNPLKSADLDSSSNAELHKGLSLLLLLSRSLLSSSKAYTQIIDEMLTAVIHLACTSSSANIRDQTVDVASVVCTFDPTRALRAISPILLQYLKKDFDDQRLNACRLLQNILDAIGTMICPFVRCLLPVAMSLMTDPVEECARLAAGAFAALVRVSPLVEKRSDATSMPELDDLAEKKSDKVIDHLIHGEPLPLLRLPGDIQACLGESETILRGYQQEGIAWMHFLQSVNLNGALCDDMGLGKTLQALIGIALAHSELDDRFTNTDEQKVGDSSPKCPGPVSLIVCPSTVVGHWMNEIHRYFPDDHVYRPLNYTGPASKRRAMLQEGKLKGCNIIVTSYSVLRNDIEALSALSWTYCTLDEGHLLKNPKSATAKAARRIKSRHKLILTGTPVQNNVNELWAVFNFLMPNFLETEASFTKSFAKPIINGQVVGASPDAINLAMNKLKLLHQTVLPFILRREKQDVMKELPPKVISDIPCALSSEQAALYRQFVASSEAKHALATLQKSIHLAHEKVATNKEQSLGQDVLRSLLYLRLLCTHPMLVAERTEKPKGDTSIDLFQKDNDAGSNMDTYSRLDCSGKLLALKDLLQSAAIFSDGLSAADNDQSTLYAGRIVPDTTSIESGGDLGDSNLAADDLDIDDVGDELDQSASKCLIFAQFTRSLDVVEDFLFVPHMPSLRYLRIDGQVVPEERTKRVDQFNGDESIKVMLLTTRVGGLGLNLTGADTVIFLEHDWNPFSDLQAMDRAHRIGQTRTVNVYRLISSDTIEEKIMKLQSIKMEMSKAIVNSDNSTMYSMGTDRLLDLFTFEGRDQDDADSKGKSNGGTAHTHLLDNISSEEGEYSSLTTESFLHDLLLKKAPPTGG